MTTSSSIFVAITCVDLTRCFGFAVVGIVAFIRGMIMLNKVGGQGAQPGTMGKALTHIVGGLLAINMWGFWEVIENTLLG